MDNVPEPTPEIKDSEIQLVRDEMNALMNMPGWKRIVEFLRRKIELNEKILNGDIDSDDYKIRSIEELDLIRTKRNLCIQLMNLPEIIIEATIRAKGEEIDNDPYDKTTNVSSY